MAKRPVFHVINDKVVISEVEFKWFAGFASIQKQRSITSLHETAKLELNFESILEISSKSMEPEGAALSAFNLKLIHGDKQFTVETAFQGSKVFDNGNCYQDIYDGTSLQAKKDLRLKESGNIVSFRFMQEEWPSTPKRMFYNWLYLNAVHQNQNLAKRIIDAAAFTDIEFNPKKSLNCQAYSAALYQSLHLQERLKEALSSKENFIRLSQSDVPTNNIQPMLF